MAQQQYEWFVKLPDKSDALQTRLAHIQEHMAYVKPEVEAGRITMAGPLFSSQPTTPDEGRTKMNGSVRVVRAGSEDEVWRLVKADPFAKLGVWDLDSATALPMKVGVMKSL